MRKLRAWGVSLEGDLSRRHDGPDTYVNAASDLAFPSMGLKESKVGSRRTSPQSACLVLGACERQRPKHDGILVPPEANAAGAVVRHSVKCAGHAGFGWAVPKKYYSRFLVMTYEKGSLGLLRYDS